MELDYNMQWWEYVTTSGLPRFYLFIHYNVKQPGLGPGLGQICVVELKPDAKNLPYSLRSKRIKHILLQTVPMVPPPVGEWPGHYGRTGSRARKIYDRAERVVLQLNKMPLSVMAVEVEKGGLQKLFDKLWIEDVELYDNVYPRITQNNDLSLLREPKPKRRSKK